MKYNVIHKQYRLSMGLYFSLQNDHPEYGEQWVCKSNIPVLHLTTYDAELSKEQVVEKIVEFINTNQINTEWE